MEPTIETLEARPALGIRAEVKMQEIGNRMGELIGRVMAVAGPHCAGPIVSRWHTWEDDGGEMEVAVPVREAMEDQGELKASTLPAGPAAVLVHVGAYDNLIESWTALGTWMKENGKVGRAAPWEEYIDDPGATPASEVRTRIVWPIE